jgi:hypothetical protein
MGIDRDKQDAVRAFPRDDGWIVSPIRHEGHDGWDNSIIIDSQGVAHTASIDPSDFGSQDGIEYTKYDGSWKVEPIGSGRIKYEFGTSIGFDLDGLPEITNYDDINRTLKFAKKIQKATGKSNRLIRTGTLENFHHSHTMHR